MEVWFMRREICRRTSTAMAQIWVELSSPERPGSVADRKTEMCSIFDIWYMISVFTKECKVMLWNDVTEKGTQLRLDTICGGSHSGLSTTWHQSQHQSQPQLYRQSPPRNLAITRLTPTSVPWPNIPRWGYAIKNGFLCAGLLSWEWFRVVFYAKNP